MRDEQFLLGGHGGRAAAARPERAELLQVVVRPRAVEAGAQPLAPFHPADRSGQGEAKEDHRGQKERLEGEAMRDVLWGACFIIGCTMSKALFAETPRSGPRLSRR